MGQKQSREAKLRSKRYGRMFTMLFFGLVFLATGIVGLDLRRNAEPRWAGRPLLWQAGSGAAMIVLGIYWSRRLDDPRLHRRAVNRRPLKQAGSGRSPGAETANRERLER